MCPCHNHNGYSLGIKGLLNTNNQMNQELLYAGEEKERRKKKGWGRVGGLEEKESGQSDSEKVTACLEEPVFTHGNSQLWLHPDMAAFLYSP